MLATNRSAGVAPEVNLSHAATKHEIKRVHLALMQQIVAVAEV